MSSQEPANKPRDQAEIAGWFRELPDRMPAIRVAVIYGVVGGLWILFSDALVELLTSDPNILSTLQTYKGLGFIIVSTLGLYLLVLFQTRAIRQRQLLADKQAQLQRSLADLGRRALELNDLDQIYEEVLNEVARALSADLVKVVRVNAADLSVEAVKGLGWQKLRTEDFDEYLEPDYLAGQVLRSKKPVVVSRYDQRVGFKVPQLLKDEGVVSSLVMPIINDKPIGVLGVHQRSPRKFEAYQQSYLQAVANLIGQAILNHQSRQDVQLHAELLDAVGQAVIGTEPDGTIFYWNPAAEQIYGWSKAEALGRSVQELTPATGYDERAARIMQQMQTGISWEGEFRLRRKDGTEFLALVRNNLLRDEAGEIRAMVGITTDVTRIKEAQRALQQATSRLTLLHQIDRQILAGETPGQISEMVLTSLQDQLPSNNNIVAEFDLHAGKARALAHIGSLDRFEQKDWFPIQEMVAISEQKMAAEPIVYIRDLLNLENLSKVSQELKELGQRSLLIARLVIGQQAVGALGVSRAAPNAFTAEDIDFINSVADSLAIGIYQAKLRQQERKRALELEQLQKLSVNLVSKLELDNLLSDVTQAAFELLSADDSYLYLPTGEKGELEYAAGISRDNRLRQGTRKIRSDGITNTVAKSGKRQVVERVAEHPKLNDEFPEWKGAIISEPILYHGEVLGVLNIGFDSARQFSETELMITRLLSDMVATTIHNAEQYRDLQRRQLESDALFRITQRLSGQYQLDDVFEAILYSITEVIDGAEAASLWMSQDESQLLKPQAWVGHDEREMADLQMARDQSVVGKIFTEKLPLYVPDTEQSNVFSPLGKKAVDRIRSTIGVPIWVGQEVIGALFADSFAQVGAFSQYDFRMLQLLANQAATAIQRVWLFDQVKAGRSRLEALSRQLVMVQEEERRRLARELHDEIGQLLTGLKLTLEMGKEKTETGSSDSLDQAIEMSEELLGQVRDLSLQLRPGMLDDLGLLPTIIWQSERAKEQLGLEVHLAMEGIDERRFPMEIETTVYRVVQESLTNVARHAKTDQVWISSWLQDETLFVQVQDEGAGFAVDSVMQSGSAEGLFGMRERARLIKGRLEVNSVPAEGTTITLSLPIKGQLERRSSDRRQP